MQCSDRMEDRLSLPAPPPFDARGDCSGEEAYTRGDGHFCMIPCAGSNEGEREGSPPRLPQGVVTVLYLEGEGVLGDKRESGAAGLMRDEFWPWMIHWGKILSPRAAGRRESQ